MAIKRIFLSHNCIERIASSKTMSMSEIYKMVEKKFQPCFCRDYSKRCVSYFYCGYIESDRKEIIEKFYTKRQIEVPESGKDFSENVLARLFNRYKEMNSNFEFADNKYYVLVITKEDDVSKLKKLHTTYPIYNIDFDDFDYKDIKDYDKLTSLLNNTN